MKTCTLCNVTKPLSDFYKRDGDKFVARCKRCCYVASEAARKKNPDAGAARRAEWRRRNKEKVRSYARKYSANNKRQSAERSRYRNTGFTPEEFASVFDKQKGRCAICFADISSSPESRMAADHCHATGRPRGILCPQCNSGLGFFKDSQDRLRNAIAYLKAPPAQVQQIFYEPLE